VLAGDVAALRDDETWTADLARHGEEAAIQGRDPHTLGTVLEHSADWARQHGDHRKAEAQWVRALAIWDRLPEHEPVARVLGALVDLYRAWGRFHRALDAGFDLVSQTQRVGDERSAALALHEVGVTMLAAHRPDSAVDYLNQADLAMGRLAEPVTADRAHTLVALGRAYWQLRKWTRARRQFSAALALWVDLDDIESDRVRQLLRQSAGGPLP
jgi:tetratricopeptide (TPR) repeat protein